jgi:hypothetical protein
VAQEEQPEKQPEKKRLKGAEKWRLDHQKVRLAHGLAPANIPKVPSEEEPAITGDWSGLMSEREQDLLLLLKAISRKQGCSSDTTLATLETW